MLFPEVAEVLNTLASKLTCALSQRPMLSLTPTCGTVGVTSWLPKGNKEDFAFGVC